MRVIFVFLLVAIGTFIIDQNIKMLFVEGYYRAGECIDLELHYNKVYFVFKEGYLKRYAFPVGLLIGGALGNVYDRFVHEGVVDYIAWHCGFNFAVFNYADVAIDLAIAWILVMVYFFPEESEEK